MNLQKITHTNRFSLWLNVDIGSYLLAFKKDQLRMTWPADSIETLSELAMFLDEIDTDLLNRKMRKLRATETRMILDQLNIADEYREMRLEAYERHGDVNAFG